MRQYDNVVEALIQAFQKNALHACLKTHILVNYMDNLKFTQVEGFLNAIEKFITGDV